MVHLMICSSVVNKTRLILGHLGMHHRAGAGEQVLQNLF